MSSKDKKNKNKSAGGKPSGGGAKTAADAPKAAAAAKGADADAAKGADAPKAADVASGNAASGNAAAASGDAAAASGDAAAASGNAAAASGNAAAASGDAAAASGDAAAAAAAASGKAKADDKKADDKKPAAKADDKKADDKKADDKKPAAKADDKKAPAKADPKKPAAKAAPAKKPDDDDDDDDEDDDDEDDDDDDDDDAPARRPGVLVAGRSAPLPLIGGLVSALQRKRGAKTPRSVPRPDIFEELTAWIGKHGPLPALFLLMALCCVMYKGLFGGEIAGDDLTFHLAESARLADCIRAGDFDWWNPAGNGGYASAYYYQVLPQLTSAIPAAFFGHLLFWFQLSNLLPLVLAPAAAYRGLRQLGASSWQAFAGAFCVAMMNGESRWGSGAAGSFQVGLYTQTWALSAFPLALGYGGRWIMKGDKLAPAVAWGAFVALCHPFAWIGLSITLSVGWLAYVMPARRFAGWPSWVGTFIAFASITTILIPPTWSSAHLSYIAIPIGLLGGALLPFLVRVPNNQWTFKPWRDIGASLARLALLGVLMVFAWMPVWLPLLKDYAGFGGFPHRVGDEVGPGFIATLDWFVHGKILDWTTVPNDTRWPILTCLVPVVASFARAPILRWLWTPALVFALFLGIGPHMSTTQDDLLPMVRFLGAMQTLLALGIGSGVVIGGAYIWKLVEKTEVAYLVRTILAIAGSALLVLIGVPGYKALDGRIRTMMDYPTQHHDELLEVADELTKLPAGRKQGGPGTENHWWNLLTYVYGRTPALLQMGGGGLQSSPNYDYLWSERDFTKNAWLYDAPYVVFSRDRAARAPAGDTVYETHAHRFRVHMKSWLTPMFTVDDAGPGNYLIRKLPSPGLISPVEVTGVLRPGTRKGDPGHDDALAWLKSDLPLADHVLAYNGFGGVSGTPDARTLNWRRQMSPGDDADMVANVEVNKPTTFVMRESWHPRWHVYIDGVEAPVRRVTPDFPAVDVPVGTHEIAFRFERPWWAIADWLAWPGISLGAWFLLRRWRKKHPLPVTPEPTPLPKARIARR